VVRDFHFHPITPWGRRRKGQRWSAHRKYNDIQASYHR